MKKSVIIAASRRVDGKGSLTETEEAERSLRERGFDLTKFYIDPLSKGWDTPLEENHFRSGCAPLEALSRACRLLKAGKADAVLISGEDNLKSDYAANKALRNRLMAIYGESYPLTEAYTDLAWEFMKNVGLSQAQFKSLSQKLFENYTRTALREGIYQLPDTSRLTYITELFRAVDCANPTVDFSGRVVLVNSLVADVCGVPLKDRVVVSGVGLDQTAGDGPGCIPEIARYEHLTSAYNQACTQAGIDYRQHYLAGKALLEVYTCYPVVPLAFLLASGIASCPQEIPTVLEQHEVTVTGGMNLAKAPWNNPALNALIVMVRQLRNGVADLGAVHGNGGLGYKQGVALLTV